MKNELLPAIEMRDVPDGSWIWRSKIPFDCGKETLILDPQAPPEDAVEVWERLDGLNSPMNSTDAIRLVR